MRATAVLAAALCILEMYPAAMAADPVRMPAPSTLTPEDTMGGRELYPSDIYHERDWILGLAHESMPSTVYIRTRKTVDPDGLVRTDAVVLHRKPQQGIQRTAGKVEIDCAQRRFRIGEGNQLLDDGTIKPEVSTQPSQWFSYAGDKFQKVYCDMTVTDTDTDMPDIGYRSTLAHVSATLVQALREVGWEFEPAATVVELCTAEVHAADGRSLFAVSDALPVASPSPADAFSRWMQEKSGESSVSVLCVPSSLTSAARDRLHRIADFRARVEAVGRTPTALPAPWRPDTGTR